MTSLEEPGAAAPTGQLLTAQTSYLEELIRRANSPGNLDGLLAHYVLGGRRLSFDWEVNPMTPTWLADNKDRFAHPHGLAGLGYGLASFPSTASRTAREHLAAGLPALTRRNPFPPDGVAFVNDARQVIGLALAVDAARDDVPRAHDWLVEVLQDPRLRAANTLLGLFHEQARQIVGIAPDLRVDPRAVHDLVDAACFHWLTATAKSPLRTDHDELRQLRSRLLSGIILTDTGQLPAPRAALLLDAVTRIVTASVDDMLLSRDHVSVLLRRFETAMRQWRHDRDDLENPIKWPITSEREIQNILWLMLRPVFDDLVDEETLPRIGHSTYRADFGIPSLELLIEVKYARKAADFKSFEKEIFEDYIGYLSDNTAYRHMTVFIYDESCSGQEHDTTRNALLRLSGITDVIIVSRPSHIPVPGRTPRRRRGSGQGTDDASSN
ncbi:hypothetical protein ACN6K5_000294 [Streptomyces violaceoruber]|uniref:PD-(D/E)XK nuclease domain-containing protein n=1 Tax=Streptomyces violaceoruber group TaxID=2867121 RepID=UPI0033F5FFAB